MTHRSHATSTKANRSETSGLPGPEIQPRNTASRMAHRTGAGLLAGLVATALALPFDLPLPAFAEGGGDTNGETAETSGSVAEISTDDSLQTRATGPALLAAPSLTASITLKEAGTAPFDANNAPGNATGTIGSGPGGSTPVRVNDVVTYTVELNANGPALTSPVFKIVFPKGQFMTAMPGFCLAGSTLTPEDPFANVTLPLSETSNEQVQEQTLSCVRGDMANETQSFDLAVKIGNLVPNGHEYAPISAELSGSYLDDETGDPETATAEIVDIPSVVASSALKWNLSKNGTALDENTGPVGQTQDLCPWTGPGGEAVTCKVFRYPTLIGAPANGKGAMPAIGNTSWTENLQAESLFPGLSAADYAAINANPEKFGARARPWDGVYYKQPARALGSLGSDETNAVRQSGNYASTAISAPNAPLSVSLIGTDWSLKTYPTHMITPQNEALPGNTAYAVSNEMYLYVPIETIRTFGTDAGDGARNLTVRNAYSDFTVSGFEGTVQEGNYTEDPDLLYREQNTNLLLPGSMGKKWAGVPGTPGNTPRQDYSPANPIWEGPPGDTLRGSGNITAAAGQNIISALYAQGPSVGDSALPMLLCDAWDPAKLQLRAASIPGSTTGAGMQRHPSNGAAAWLSGYVARGVQTLPPETVPHVIQYSSVPVTPGNAASTSCGDVINGQAGDWHDSPEQVPGNDPTLEAEGIYTAVTRVRAWVLMPDISSFPGTGGLSLLNISVSQRVNPAYNAQGSVVPNWAGYAFDRTGSTSFEQTIASVNSGATKFTSSNAGATGPMSGIFDRLTIAATSARIEKEVALIPAGSEAAPVFSQVAPAGTNGDQVIYRLSPKLSSAAGSQEIFSDLTVEDCLPAQLNYSGASRAPSFTAPAGQEPPEAEMSCAAGETYLQWKYDSLQVNQAIDPIIVSTTISATAANGSFTNTASVSAPTDLSPLSQRQSDAQAANNPVAAVVVGKKLLTPVTQVNRQDNGAAQINEQMQWENTLYNGTNQMLAGGRMIDVLPRTASTVADIVTSRAAVGTLALVSATSTGDPARVLYTANPAVVADPTAESNGQTGSTAWCDAFDGTGTLVSGSGACPANGAQVTGVQWESLADIPVSEDIGGTVTMIATGNQPGNTYPSSVMGSGTGLTAPVGPARAEVAVIGSSIGDYVWWNLPEDGSQTLGGAELNPPAAGVTVALEGTDDLGNPVSLTAVTDSSGNYLFAPLRSGDYVVTFELPDGAAGFTIQHADGLPEGDDSAADQQTGQANVSLARDSQHLTTDAGLIPVDGEFADISVEKNVVASTPVGDDRSATVSYELIVRNDGIMSGSYTLEDVLRFGGSIKITEVTAEGPQGIDLVAGFDGVTQTVLVRDESIAAAATHTFTVEVTATVETTITEAEADCTLTSTESGTGFLNEAKLESSNTTVTDTACVGPGVEIVPTNPGGGLPVTGGTLLTGAAVLGLIAIAGGVLLFLRSRRNRTP